MDSEIPEFNPSQGGNIRFSSKGVPPFHESSPKAESSATSLASPCDRPLGLRKKKQIQLEFGSQKAGDFESIADSEAFSEATRRPLQLTAPKEQQLSVPQSRPGSSSLGSSILRIESANQMGSGPRSPQLEISTMGGSRSNVGGEESGEQRYYNLSQFAKRQTQNPVEESLIKSDEEASASGQSRIIRGGAGGETSDADYSSRVLNATQDNNLLNDYSTSRLGLNFPSPKVPVDSAAKEYEQRSSSRNRLDRLDASGTNSIQFGPTRVSQGGTYTQYIGPADMQIASPKGILKKKSPVRAAQSDKLMTTVNFDMDNRQGIPAPPIPSTPSRQEPAGLEMDQINILNNLKNQLSDQDPSVSMPPSPMPNDIEAGFGSFKQKFGISITEEDDRSSKDLSNLIQTRLLNYGSASGGGSIKEIGKEILTSLRAEPKLDVTGASSLEHVQPLVSIKELIDKRKELELGIALQIRKISEAMSTQVSSGQILQLENRKKVIEFRAQLLRDQVHNLKVIEEGFFEQITSFAYISLSFLGCSAFLSFLVLIATIADMVNPRDEVNTSESIAVNVFSMMWLLGFLAAQLFTLRTLRTSVEPLVKLEEKMPSTQLAGFSEIELIRLYFCFIAGTTVFASKASCNSLTVRGVDILSLALLFQLLQLILSTIYFRVAFLQMKASFVAIVPLAIFFLSQANYERVIALAGASSTQEGWAVIVVDLAKLLLLLAFKLLLLSRRFTLVALKECVATTLEPVLELIPIISTIQISEFPIKPVQQRESKLLQNTPNFPLGLPQSQKFNTEDKKNTQSDKEIESSFELAKNPPAEKKEHSEPQFKPEKFNPFSEIDEYVFDQQPPAADPEQKSELDIGSSFKLDKQETLAANFLRMQTPNQDKVGGIDYFHFLGGAMLFTIQDRSTGETSSHSHDIGAPTGKMGRHSKSFKQPRMLKIAHNEIRESTHLHLEVLKITNDFFDYFSKIQLPREPGCSPQQPFKVLNTSLTGGSPVKWTPKTPQRSYLPKASFNEGRHNLKLPDITVDSRVISFKNLLGQSSGAQPLTSQLSQKSMMNEQPSRRSKATKTVPFMNVPDISMHSSPLSDSIHLINLRSQEIDKNEKERDKMYMRMFEPYFISRGTEILFHTMTKKERNKDKTLKLSLLDIIENFYRLKSMQHTKLYFKVNLQDFQKKTPYKKQSTFHFSERRRKSTLINQNALVSLKTQGSRNRRNSECRSSDFKSSGIDTPVRVSKKYTANLEIPKTPSKLKSNQIGLLEEIKESNKEFSVRSKSDKGAKIIRRLTKRKAKSSERTSSHGQSDSSESESGSLSSSSFGTDESMKEEVKADDVNKIKDKAEAELEKLLAQSIPINYPDFKQRQAKANESKSNIFFEVELSKITDSSMPAVSAVSTLSQFEDQQVPLVLIKIKEITKLIDHLRDINDSIYLDAIEANFAHENNTPLNIIQSGARQLQKNLKLIFKELNKNHHDKPSTSACVDSNYTFQVTKDCYAEKFQQTTRELLKGVEHSGLQMGMYNSSQLCRMSIRNGQFRPDPRFSDSPEKFILQVVEPFERQIKRDKIAVYIARRNEFQNLKLWLSWEHYMNILFSMIQNAVKYNSDCGDIVVLLSCKRRRRVEVEDGKESPDQLRREPSGENQHELAKARRPCYLDAPSPALSELQDEYVLETEVIDTGLGISEQRQGYLFVPFQELKQAESLKQVKDFTIGMGLACSYAIVRRLGGDIMLKQSQVGGPQGAPGLTAFGFRLPVRALEPKRKESSKIDLDDLEIQRSDENLEPAEEERKSEEKAPFKVVFEHVLGAERDVLHRNTQAYLEAEGIANYSVEMSHLRRDHEEAKQRFKEQRALTIALPAKQQALPSPLPSNKGNMTTNNSAVSSRKSMRWGTERNLMAFLNQKDKQRLSVPLGPPSHFQGPSVFKLGSDHSSSDERFNAAKNSSPELLHKKTMTLSQNSFYFSSKNSHVMGDYSPPLGQAMDLHKLEDHAKPSSKFRQPSNFARGANSQESHPSDSEISMNRGQLGSKQGEPQETYQVNSQTHLPTMKLIRQDRSTGPQGGASVLKITKKGSLGHHMYTPAQPRLSIDFSEQRIQSQDEEEKFQFVEGDILQSPEVGYHRLSIKKKQPGRNLLKEAADRKKREAARQSPKVDKGARLSAPGPALGQSMEHSKTLPRARKITSSRQVAQAQQSVSHRGEGGDSEVASQSLSSGQIPTSSNSGSDAPLEEGDVSYNFIVENEETALPSAAIKAVSAHFLNNEALPIAVNSPSFPGDPLEESKIPSFSDFSPFSLPLQRTIHPYQAVPPLSATGLTRVVGASLGADQPFNSIIGGDITAEAVRSRIGSFEQQLAAVTRQCTCSPKILLVDDTEFNLLALSTVIEEFCGHTQHQAKDGEEALALFKQEFEKPCGCADRGYRIIFMDIQMPKKDGIAATREILEYSRAHTKFPEAGEEELSDIPRIIGQTAYPNFEQPALDAGMLWVARKPIVAQDLRYYMLRYFWLQSEEEVRKIMRELIQEGLDRA